MAGELWLEEVRVAKEVTLGVPVTPATRRLYLQNPILNDDGENQFHDFPTGTPEQTRAVTPAPQVISGRFELPVSADELVEIMLLTIKGGVTPTTPGGATLTREWTFTPGSTLDSMTMERMDGANAWQGAGLRGNVLEITGSTGPTGMNMARLDLLGTQLNQQALSGSPTERVPFFVMGWETKLFIDAFGATPGTTAVDGFLKNWRITVNRNMDRKYLAENLNRASGVPIGRFAADFTFTFEAAKANALTEWNNARTATKRLLRLEFGNNEVIEGAFKRAVIFDLPGAWSGRSLGGEDAGTRMYEFNGRALYDPTNGFSFRSILRNSRTAAWN